MPPKKDGQPPAPMTRQQKLILELQREQDRDVRGKRNRGSGSDASSSGSSSGSGSSSSSGSSDSSSSSGDSSSSSGDDTTSSSNAGGHPKRKRKPTQIYDPTPVPREKKRSKDLPPEREAAKRAVRRLEAYHKAGGDDDDETLHGQREYEAATRAKRKKGQHLNYKGDWVMASDDSDNDVEAQQRELRRLKERRRLEVAKRLEGGRNSKPMRGTKGGGSSTTHIPDECYEESTEEEDDEAVSTGSSDDEIHSTSEDEVKETVGKALKRKEDLTDHFKKHCVDKAGKEGDLTKWTDSRLLRHSEFDRAASVGATAGGGGPANNQHSEPGGDGAEKKPVSMETHVDPTGVSFASVGGLPSHILTLREMILLPLLYPQLMQHLNIKPPRGVLFVGPPGTGKTLTARALAAEGRSHGHHITFFLRKGGDLLSKWVGESEQQLKQLFDEAKAKQPSIIFFDEIDGVAPVRSANIESTHGSVVSTLLALMDGIEDRGQVMVIGATNRPDVIDPALRRPGRFDRELHFPNPNPGARRHILSIHLKGKEPQPVQDTLDSEKAAGIPEDLLSHLVDQTAGWSGADLGALVTEASLMCLRRSVPHIYVHGAGPLNLGNLDSVQLSLQDFRSAAAKVQPTSTRSGDATAQALAVGTPCDLLIKSQKEAAIQQLAQSWSVAQSVLDSQHEQCDDLALAAVNFSRPAPGKAGVANGGYYFLLVGGGSPFAEKILVSAVARALPTLTVHCVHLPNLLFTRNGEGSHSAAGNSATHQATTFGGIIQQILISSGGTTGSILVLEGVVEWLRALEDEAETSGSDGTENSAKMLALRSVPYNLSKLQFHNVLIVADSALRAFLNLGLGGSDSQQAPPILEVTANAGPPAAADLESFVKHLFEQTVSGLVPLVSIAGIQAQLEAAQRDAKSLLSYAKTEKSLTRQQRHQKRQEAQKEYAVLWKRICYKRAQLRVVLRTFITAHITGNQFKSLFDDEVDLVDEEELKAWRKHTRKHRDGSGGRIGLVDIADKVDNCTYVCMSEYLEDVQLLADNVTSFFTDFRSDPRHARYRQKANQLKDVTLLNTHRVNRKLAAFCLQYKDYDENGPASLEEDSSSSEESDEEEPDAKPKPPPKKKAKRRNNFGGLRTPPKKKKKVIVVEETPHPEVKTENTQGEEKEEEEEEDAQPLPVAGEAPVPPPAPSAAMVAQDPHVMGMKEEDAVKSVCLLLKECPLHQLYSLSSRVLCQDLIPTESLPRTLPDGETSVDGTLDGRAYTCGTYPWTRDQISLRLHNYILRLMQ